MVGSCRIGMLVPPRERGKYKGVMMAVMPAAMIGGPLVGGFITDNLVALGLLRQPAARRRLAVRGLVHPAASHERRHAGKVSIDWRAPACSPSGSPPWCCHHLGRPPVRVGLVADHVLSWWRWSASSRSCSSSGGWRADHAAAAVPNANFTLAGTLGFIAGFAMFGGITFLPQFQQFVQGASATNSGLLLMPMMIAAMVFSLAGGQFISRTGHYRTFPIVGTVLMVVGLGLFSTMGIDTPTWVTSLYMVVLGAGMGCLMQTTTLIAQNSVPMRDVGAATGASTFVRNLGGSLGVAILGAIYAAQVTSTLNAAGVSGAPPSNRRPHPGGPAEPAGTRAGAVQASGRQRHTRDLHGRRGDHRGRLLVSWFIKQVPLRDTASVPTRPRSRRLSRSSPRSCDRPAAEFARASAPRTQSRERVKLLDAAIAPRQQTTRCGAA